MRDTTSKPVSLTLPVSTTCTTSSMVTDVSARFVEKTICRRECTGTRSRLTGCAKPFKKMSAGLCELLRVLFDQIVRVQTLRMPGGGRSNTTFCSVDAREECRPMRKRPLPVAWAMTGF